MRTREQIDTEHAEMSASYKSPETVNLHQNALQLEVLLDIRVIPSILLGSRAYT